MGLDVKDYAARSQVMLRDVAHSFDCETIDKEVFFFLKALHRSSIVCPKAFPATKAL